jgi:hypothetical protein
VREFFGTEAAFLSVLFAFNLLGLYQRQLDPACPYRQPATLRSQVFVAGAILGLVSKQAARTHCLTGNLTRDVHCLS